jgi:hypothetical protein
MPTQERDDALAAAEGTCPRCGAARQADQEYCVECGLRLPPLKGAVPSLRRRWIRRVGWYPGDWVWISLLLFLVAAAGASASIVLTKEKNDNAGSTFVAPRPVSSVALPTTAPTATGSTPTLTAPEPTVTKPPKQPAGPPNGRTVWPVGKNGWTIVLISYPKTGGRPAALATATRAAKAHLPEVGVLDSARFPSLHPGYYVVFSGIYGAKASADAALRTARASGFAGAYSRQISR